MTYEEMLMLQQLQTSKYIEMNDNGDYDVILVEDVCQIDINTCHDKAELPAVISWNELHKKDSAIEFKSMPQTRYTFFIEYEVDRKGNGTYEPSGITNTKANHYWINLCEEIDFQIKPAFLKWLFKYKDELNLQTEPSTTSDRNVTTGMLIPVDCLFELIKLYIQYKQGISIEELKAKMTDPELHRKLQTTRAQNILKEKLKNK
jgi:hypothetical protein